MALTTNLTISWAHVSDYLEIDTAHITVAVIRVRSNLCPITGHHCFPRNSHWSSHFTKDQSMITTVSQWLITGHHYFPLTNHWSLLFPSDQSLVTTISQGPINDHHYFPVTNHWSLLFPKDQSLCRHYFPVNSHWSLLFPSEQSLITTVCLTLAPL